jgi:hypothetical protein
MASRLQTIGALSVAFGLSCTAGGGTEAGGDGEDALPAASAGPPTRDPPRLPTGPGLPIDPGLGVGAIRFGATVATIERLMQKRCEVLSENLCRYVTRGVDFHLVGGELVEVHAQRAGRPAGRDAQGKPVEFGFFNGGIRPDLSFGMIPSAMQEYLGPPERTEPVPEPNPQTMVARDHYPGLVIEYDRYKNGRIIWGGAIVRRDPRVRYDGNLAITGLPIDERTPKVALPRPPERAPATTADDKPRRPVVIH